MPRAVGPGGRRHRHRAAVAGEIGPAAAGTGTAARRVVCLSAGESAGPRDGAARLIEAAPRAPGEHLDPDHAARVPVIEYEVPDRDGERIFLTATITDPTDASAPELAGAYHQRWGAT